MVQKVFTVYDEKAEAYLSPFFMATVAMAIRAITECVTDLNHQFGKNTADYTLFQLGEYDDSSGEFTNDKKPLGNLVEFKIPSAASQPALVEVEKS